MDKQAKKDKISLICAVFLLYFRYHLSEESNMKRKLSLLLACMLLCMFFASCGKPAEIAVGPISDEEIARMKEKAATVGITVEIGEFSQRLGNVSGSITPHIRSLEKLIADFQPDKKSWKEGVEKALKGFEQGKKSLESVKASSSVEDLQSIALAVCEMYLASCEKLLLACEKDPEENVKLANDYMLLAKKYLDEQIEYLGILLS